MPAEGLFGALAFGVFFVMWVILPSKFANKARSED